MGGPGDAARKGRILTVSSRLLRQLIAFAVMTAMLVTLAPAPAAHAADSRTLEQIQTIAERRINKARAAHGLRPLRVNRKMEYWATDHARRMARRRTLFHDSLTRLRYESPTKAIAWGENVARNTAPNAARRAHYMFMRSPGHRANILNPAFTHMGIGVRKRGRYTYLVQRFATVR